MIDGLQARPLLEQISRGGVKRADLAGDQPTLDRLSALNLVRDRGGEYALGFPWFAAADQAEIDARVTPFARTLADEVLGRRAEIEAQLDRLTCSGWADRRDLRFAMVGCFGLDWGGLEALTASGHIIWLKDQPGGRRYYAWYEEPCENRPDRLYNGSRRGGVGNFTWTSFGDHSGRRFGLPDLLWQTAGAVYRYEVLPEWQRPLLRDVVLDALDAPLQSAADGLAAAVRGAVPPEGPGRRLLEAAGALKDGRPAVPVFCRREDGPAIDRIVQIVQESLERFVRGWYTGMEQALSGMTPLRHSIPFQECFNAIYHVLFGQANRLLAEDGYLTDPEPTEPGEGRYRCWLTVEK